MMMYAHCTLLRFWLDIWLSCMWMSETMGRRGQLAL